MDGFAEATEEGLLLRDTKTGKPLDEVETVDVGGDADAGSGNQYYPSFDMALYPDGACLNDGNQPGSYAMTPSEFLFDDHEKCCREWFIDVELCLAAAAAGGNSPTSFPTWDLAASGSSPWPTWSDDMFNTEDAEADEGTTSQFSAASFEDQVAEATAVSSEAQVSQGSQGTPAPAYTFVESFENGDFSSNPWKLTSSVGVDPWSAERTALAYEGRFAARPGILTEEGSVTNLTIALNDLDDNGTPDGIFGGGLLTFAIHAAVDMPVDAIYFTINNHVIRTFDAVTGYVAGDWEEVSTLLLPGEHTLTWSYQFYGFPDDMSKVDERREGNSWIDDIRLTPYTGDFEMEDGDVALLDMSNGVAPWTVVQDPNAYEGDKSYIAYSQDIVSSQGSIEMTWTIIASPEGGAVSFAAFASIYAPHDVLEFGIDGAPKVAVTVPSYNWEEFVIEVDPGKHICTWKLVKNVPGLEDNVIDGVDVPFGYQGYVKVDGIKYEDNMKEVVSTPAAMAAAVTTAAAATTLEPTTTQIQTTTAAETTPAVETTTVAETTSAPETTTEAAEATTETAQTEVTTEAAETTPSSTEGTSGSDATTTEAPGGSDATSTAATGGSDVAMEAMADAVDTSSGCPEGLQEVSGLPGCCVEEPNFLGDGACDPWEPYNTEACGYDLGDCCHDTCKEDSPYGCHTKEGADYGPFGFFCLDPRSESIVVDVEKCKVENREWIGDGGCDADSEYNTPECGYDGGDCCEDTCDQDWAFYTCGTNQPYQCLSEGEDSQGEETGAGANPFVEASTETPSTAAGSTEAPTGSTLT